MNEYDSVPNRKLIFYLFLFFLLVPNSDYISPRVTELMIQYGPQACFMRDKKGYLAAHVACSRHCSPEKLRMLLAVNPESLVTRTNDGQTLLSLAIGTATKSHPNYALIDAIRTKLDGIGVGINVPRGIAISPQRRRRRRTPLATSSSSATTSSFRKALTRRRANASHIVWESPSLNVASASATTTSTTMDEYHHNNCNHNHSKGEGNIRKVTDESTDESNHEGSKKQPALEEDPVSLLLNFSRGNEKNTRVEQV